MEEETNSFLITIVVFLAEDRAARFLARHTWRAGARAVARVGHLDRFEKGWGEGSESDDELHHGHSRLPREKKTNKFALCHVPILLLPSVEWKGGAQRVGHNVALRGGERRSRSFANIKRPHSFLVKFITFHTLH